MLNKKAVLLSTGMGLGLMGFSGIASADELYTVQSGDTVGSISLKYHTTIDNIGALNHLSDVNKIYVGQQLTIPTSTVQYKQATPVKVQSAQRTQTQQIQPVAQKQQVQKAQTSTGGLSESEAAAKEWIAQRESGGSYYANNNNKYIGRYQLDASYLNGDYSPANQERTVSKYIAERYQGSWVKAKAFWQANGYY